jgi:hypothetical protein
VCAHQDPLFVAGAFCFESLSAGGRFARRPYRDRRVRPYPWDFQAL